MTRDSIQLPMNTNKRPSQFNKAVKVRQKQYDWLMENKGNYKTLAGKLDEIINFYKQKYEQGNL